MRWGATLGAVLGGLACLVCLAAGCSRGAGGGGFDRPPGEVLADAFGDGIALAGDRSPATFRGDFNGDGQGDLIAVVRSEGSGVSVPAGVRVVRPWSAADEAAPADLSTGAEVMLAVVHGAAGGEGGGSYLLHDPNPVSILDAGAAREALVVERGVAATLNPELSRLARGDVLVIPTEAGIDTFLYWDGAEYRALQPLEYP